MRAAVTNLPFEQLLIDNSYLDQTPRTHGYLYRGRASVTVTVYDLEDSGKEVFRRPLPEIRFPENSVYHSSETSESSFRRAFIKVIAEKIARYFYDYDMAETYGNEPVDVS